MNRTMVLAASVLLVFGGVLASTAIGSVPRLIIAEHFDNCG
jgi:hypothetical protein